MMNKFFAFAAVILIAVPSPAESRDFSYVCVNSDKDIIRVDVNNTDYKYTIYEFDRGLVYVDSSFHAEVDEDSNYEYLIDRRPFSRVRGLRVVMMNKVLDQHPKIVMMIEDKKIKENDGILKFVFECDQETKT